MAEKVRVIQLNPTGTFDEVNGILEDKTVRTKDLVASVDRNSCFVRPKPIPIESLEEIPNHLKAKPFIEGKRYIIINRQDFSPVRFGGPPDSETQVKEAQIINKVSAAHAIAQEGERALQEERLAWFVMIAGIIAAAAAGIIILIGVTSFLGGNPPT